MATSCSLPVLPCLLQCVAHFTPGSQSDWFASDCITGVALADDGSQVLANYLGGWLTDCAWSISSYVTFLLVQVNSSRVSAVVKLECGMLCCWCAIARLDHCAR